MMFPDLQLVRSRAYTTTSMDAANESHSGESRRSLHQKAGTECAEPLGKRDTLGGSEHEYFLNVLLGEWLA